MNNNEKKIVKDLIECIETLKEYIGEPPDRDCQCHINPPCHDCVENSKYREDFEYIDSVVKIAESI